MKQATVNHGTPGVGKEDIVKRSKKSKWYVSGLGLTLALVFALFASFGCSSNALKTEDPTSGDKHNYLFDTGEQVDPQDNDAIKSPRLLESAVAVVSETVGILGGELDVVVGDVNTQFVVPVGALFVPVEISVVVTKYDTPLGPVYTYDCGPDGTKFKVPAKLSQRMPDGQSTAELFYFNESTRNWELQEVVKVKNGVATFNIKHFSKYGIS